MRDWKFSKKVIIVYPFRKFRIEIHSEPIRTIRNQFEIWVRVNANQSRPIRKKFLILFAENRWNMINSFIRIENMIHILWHSFELKFRIEWDWLRLIFKRDFHEIENFYLDWFRLIRNGSDTNFKIIRIGPEWIFIRNFCQRYFVTNAEKMWTKRTNF